MGCWIPHGENSNIYIYFIFQLILDFYHSIHTRCMEKHNLSIFTYHFSVKFIIWNMFYNITQDSHFMPLPIDPNFLILVDFTFDIVLGGLQQSTSITKSVSWPILYTIITLLMQVLR